VKAKWGGWVGDDAVLFGEERNFDESGFLKCTVYEILMLL